MDLTQDLSDRPSRSHGDIWVLAAIWIVVIGVSMLWNVLRLKANTLEAARIQARVVYEKDVVYRRWNAGHGGVYVPITEETQPNPYLADIPDRDILVPDGDDLTLMNPAYMTRQVHELQEQAFGVKGHITSLMPIRPENSADPWETEALRAFEQGDEEISSVEELNGVVYMRLMRPLITEQGCLQCHAAQGYEVGDVRGGISVAVPMEPLLAIESTQLAVLNRGHVLMSLLGFAGIALASSRISKSESERQAALDALVSLAIVDPLTGCYNRRHLFEVAEGELSRSVRYQHPLSIILLDLDEFKQVNDTYGHAAGDQVLVTVTKRIRDTLRKADTLARVGGEEFVVLLPESDLTQALQTARRLQVVVKQPQSLGGAKVRVSASFGVACKSPDEDIDFETLLKRADQAMYAGKELGGDQVMSWPPGTDKGT